MIYFYASLTHIFFIEYDFVFPTGNGNVTNKGSVVIGTDEDEGDEEKALPLQPAAAPRPAKQRQQLRNLTGKGDSQIKGCAPG